MGHCFQFGNTIRRAAFEAASFRPGCLRVVFRVGYRKPQEGIYRHACAALGVEPSAVLMVGDSLENDYTTPRQLGMQARYLKRSGKDENTPECVADLSEILA